MRIPLAAKPGPPPTKWSIQRLFRPFLRWALVVALTLGFTTGVAMLLLRGLGVPLGVGWITHTQSHGVAQLFGWAGLFVMGMAFHVVPRFRNTTVPYPWPQRAILVLVLAALMLRFTGQTLYTMAASNAILVASGVALLAGVGLFAGLMGYALRRGSAPHGPAEPWLWAGIMWALAAAAIHLAIVARMGADGSPAAPISWDNAFIHASVIGFLGNFVLGVSRRTLPAFMALSPTRQPLAQSAFWAVNIGAATQAAALLFGLSPWWVAGSAITELAGIVAFVAAIRLFEPRNGKRPYMPGAYRRYEFFVRASYAWLLVAALLQATQSSSRAANMSFLAILDAAPILHVLALGFVTMMIMGMASRMLPMFEGAELPHQSLMDVAFVCLNASVVLRLVFGLFFRAGANAGLAVSGILGLIALTAFALVAWKAMRPAAQEAYRKRLEDVVARHPPVAAPPP